jgi:hypothetical protein
MSLLGKRMNEAFHAVKSSFPFTVDQSLEQMNVNFMGETKSFGSFGGVSISENITFNVQPKYTTSFNIKLPNVFMTNVEMEQQKQNILLGEPTKLSDIVNDTRIACGIIDMNVSEFKNDNNLIEGTDRLMFMGVITSMSKLDTADDEYVVTVVQHGNTKLRMDKLKFRTLFVGDNGLSYKEENMYRKCMIVLDVESTSGFYNVLVTN